MTVLLEYPLRVLTPSNVGVVPLYRNRSAHDATNGMRRSLGFSGAAFKLVMDGIRISHDLDKVRTLRALIANLEGDRNLIRIRIPDLYGLDGPWAMATKAARKAWPDGVPFASDAMYATGVGHAVPTLEVATISSVMATENEIFVASSQELPAGVVISIDEFCYMIAGSWFEDGINRLKLSPGLRKDAPAGTVVSLAPVFVGVCTTDVPGDGVLRNAKHGTFTLEFEEDLTRLAEDFD